MKQDTRDMAEQQARHLGIEQPEHRSLHELVWTIQRAEGLDPCFRSDKRYNCQGGCGWNGECKTLLAEWHR